MILRIQAIRQTTYKGGQLASGGVTIDATNFPDEKFRNVVKEYDTDNDGVLSEAEATSVKRLSVTGKKIASLKGVEYFTALTYLDCSGNKLTALDVSKNTALTYLCCQDNQLTALDLSNNTALTDLRCESNQLTTLDVSKNTALDRLYCNDNQLTELNLSKNTALYYLSCGGNQLTALDVSKNTALLWLYCENNQITELDVSKNTDLQELYCGGNQLTTLDLGNNTKLQDVKSNWSSQTASGLKITSTGNSSYPYQFSFTDIMSSAQTANVSDVQGLDSSGGNIATTYADGVAKFASSPAKVTYNYATFGTDNDIYDIAKMDVTLTEGSDSAQVKPVITTASLPDGNTGTPYTQTLTASGSAPITWTRSAGTLPTGLTLSSGGTISGTPTKSGTFKFTVKAQNSNGSDTKQFTVRITNPSSWIKPAITTTTLDIATNGKAYSFTLEASGIPAPTWALTSGKLPAGLTLDSSGEISGTPTKSGSFKFTVRAENSLGYAQKQFTLRVLNLPVITTESLKSATVGVSYSETLTASGSTPLTWTLEGDLPDGLTFANGKISGRPKENGTFTFTAKVRNSAGEDTKTLSIESHAILPVFGTTPLPVGTWKKSYSTKITIKKGTKPVTVTMSGNLPEGLKFNAATLTISGIPEETCNAETLTFTATNMEGSTEKDFTLTVNGVKPRIKNSSLAPAVKGKEYTAQLEATGNGPITWSAANLPEGLSIDSDTGEISGTPEENGSFRVTITAANDTSSVRKTLILNVTEPPEITDDVIPEGDAEESYKYNLEYTGDSPLRFTVTDGALPNGLRLGSSNGRISGIPKESGEFTFTVTVSNTAGETAKEITLVINAAPPKITGTLKAGKSGTAYSSGLKVSSGSLPVEWSYDGTLPEGLEFDTDTGIISGTPSEAFKGYIVIKAENSGGTHKKKVRLLIREDKNTDKSSLPEEKSQLPEENTASESEPEKFNGEIYHGDSGDMSLSGIHVSDGLMIAAVLGEISCDKAGMYDFDVAVSDDVPMNAELVYMANSDVPSSDDEIAEFYDEAGKEIKAVPKDRKISVSIWLNPDTIYHPAVAVKR